MICWILNVYGIFATNSCIFKMPINGFLTCLNTSRALKMQTIECGLFAPESLSVCVPFLAKVHPVLSSEQALLSKKLQPIFKSCLTSAKTPNSSPNKRGCDFYQMKVRSYELDFLCLLFFWYFAFFTFWSDTSCYLRFFLYLRRGRGWYILIVHACASNSPQHQDAALRSCSWCTWTPNLTLEHQI